MSQYAILEQSSNQVLNVIECEPDVIATMLAHLSASPFLNPQTGTVSTDPRDIYAMLVDEKQEDNFPVTGGKYDKESNTFLFPTMDKPAEFSSFVLDHRNRWVAPVPYPKDGHMYVWYDPGVKWVPVPLTPYPPDGGNYEWDVATQAWKPVG